MLFLSCQPESLVGLFTMPANFQPLNLLINCCIDFEFDHVYNPHPTRRESFLLEEMLLSLIIPFSARKFKTHQTLFPSHFQAWQKELSLKCIYLDMCVHIIVDFSIHVVHSSPIYKVECKAETSDIC